MPSKVAKRPVDGGKDGGEPAAPARKRAKTTAREEKPARATRRDERNEVMARAKATWEELRPKAVDAEKTARLVSQLFGLLEGRVVEFVLRHDGSRIVQWMFRDGSEAQVGALMDELLAGARVDADRVAAIKAGDGEGDHLAAGVSAAPFFVRLSADRYGRHLAMKMLRVSVKYTRHRGVIFESCLKGNAAVMVRNAYGADVLDFAFQTTLNAAQRAQLVVELLFSRERKILAVVQSKLAGGADGAGKPSFSAALAACGDDFKGVVVESAGAALAAFVDKEALVRLAIVHAALDQYLAVLIADYPPERAHDLCGLLAPSLVHLAHTKAGVACAITCVKVLDAKHRKKVVRSLKGHVRALATEECGHRLLLALLEWVDDTKLVGRAISAELFHASKMVADLAIQREDDVADGGAVDDKRIKPGRVPKPAKAARKAMAVDVDGEALDVEYLTSLCGHKHGRTLFLSLLFPRDTRYFHPALYASLWTAVDEDKFGKLSKKDAGVRRAELWAQVSDALRQVVETSCRELLVSHWSAPILIGAAGQVELCDATIRRLIAEVEAVLGGAADAAGLRTNVCAQKTVAVVLKVGGPAVGAAFLDAIGVDAVAGLGAVEGWAAAASALLKCTENRDAAKAVVKAAVEIEAACGPAGARLVQEASDLRRGGSKKQRSA
jgi:hypothetical protein